MESNYGEAAENRPLGISQTIVRILGKFNSKAAKVDATRGRKRHGGAGMTFKRAALRSVAGAARGPFRERNNEATRPRIGAFRRIHHHACGCGRSLPPRAR